MDGDRVRTSLEVFGVKCALARPIAGEALHDRSATMTMPLLMLVVLIITFGVEVGWLCRC